MPDIHKLRPDRSMYLRGFDRRGAAAALHSTSFNPSTLTGGFTVSGCWNDIADFAVLVIHDADDQYGHVTTAQYLPDFSLHGVTLDFDLALTNCFSPTSSKSQSVPWGMLSYITSGGVTGTKPLNITSATGMIPASCTYTVNGSPVAGDSVALIYLGNVQFVVTVPAGALSTVTFGFFNFYGTGYSHWITIGSNTYTHVQLSTDGSGDIATALANLINAGSGDPNATASVAANNVILSPRLNTGASVACSQSDAGAGGTLIEVTNTSTYLAASIASQINSANWAAIGSVFALVATMSGATFTVYCAVYGTVNTSGTAVTWVSGQTFIGLRNGDPICIAGTLYTISTVNSATSITLSSSAGTQTGVSYAAAGGGRDGNAIELYELHLNSNAYLTPANASKLTGGVSESSLHVHIDFTALGIDSLRQAWLTLAPMLNYESSADNTAMVPYVGQAFSAVFSNWTLADPNNVLPLQIAGPGSVLISSRDLWASYSGSGWSQHLSSGANEHFYYQGFAYASAHAGDSVTITYSCQSTHDLYLGTVIGAAYGTFHVKLDGVSQPDLSCADATIGSLVTRRQLAASVAAGTHTVVLTLASSTTVYFCYLQACVRSDTQAPAVTYSNVNLACDFDTNQTYQIAPARLLWILQKLGFTGDLDFYAGVFFALKRVRQGGTFLTATVTLGGSVVAGDAYFLNVSGTSIGVGVLSMDSLTSLAQRMVNAINAMFVGVCAAPTATAGQFTITVLSPINGFSLTPTAGSSLTVTVTGSIGTASFQGGQEGVWGVDASQSSPLNQAFSDYLSDLASLMHAAGQTLTVAFSQELLAPPDQNTSAGAWTQRFLSGDPVLTDTGFGSWGAGYVESVSSGVYQQTGHGYITGNIAHFASSPASGVWELVVTDANHYTLGATLANSTGSYTPAAGDSVFIDLQTVQCAFNPSTVTPYLQKCFIQAANILAAAGLVPWLQFGEVGHWFFSEYGFIPISSMTNSGGLIEFGTSEAHGLATGQTAIVAGAPAGNGSSTVTVIDATHFTNGTAYAGPYTAGGTVSGGGMAYYDANQTAAAVAALGRALGNYYTQDDNPVAADATFLAGRIYTHISTIITAVLAAQAASRFELLYPLDVNFIPCYYTSEFPWPQGGRLNALVNLPPQFHAKAGSGLDRLKIEALSWQSQYFNQDNFVEIVRYPYNALNWSKSDIAILIAWDDQACPWSVAWQFVQSEGVPLLNFWAVDHAVLFGWPATLPAASPAVRM